ncbi:hypothetical protein [Endozoicomonas sp. ALD040]|uniref:hypothetical protein n=1 Tax=unclassified Endozoicomonas TaxID=2644528 RepID=UPI003BB1E201
MAGYLVGRKNILKAFVVFFALSGHSHLQAGMRLYKDTIVGLAILAGVTIGISYYVFREDEFIFYVSKKQAATGHPAHPLFIGVVNYQTNRWIVTSKLIGNTEEPEFVKLSDVEYWGNGPKAVIEQRLNSLFSHLEKDFQRWKNLTQAKPADVPSGFLHYSSLIASNCEAINTGSRTFKAFHKSADDYLDSRAVCQNWLDRFIDWHSYFAAYYNSSIPVVLVPDWREAKGITSDESTPSTVIGGHLQSSVAYLFNANYDFRMLSSLYGDSDQELIVVTDQPGYKLKRISWWQPRQYDIFLPEHQKLVWTEHVPCDSVTGGCRFKNFSWSAGQVTPYLLSNHNTGSKILIFHHGETLVAWCLGKPWIAENKVVMKKAKNNRFELDLMEAFDLDSGGTSN